MRLLIALIHGHDFKCNLGFQLCSTATPRPESETIGHCQLFHTRQLGLQTTGVFTMMTLGYKPPKSAVNLIKISYLTSESPPENVWTCAFQGALQSNGFEVRLVRGNSLAPPELITQLKATEVLLTSWGSPVYPKNSLPTLAACATFATLTARCGPTFRLPSGTRMWS